jgi:hypothetical protein
MSLRDRLRAGRRRPGGVAAALSRGGPLEVACRLRRTSPRGWGPWTEGSVHLGAIGGTEARWRTDDPVAVGFASTSGPVDLPFEEVTDVYLRAVRFRTEAFYGMDADIVVVDGERTTIELALAPGDAEPVAARLDALLGPFGGA